MLDEIDDTLIRHGPPPATEVIQDDPTDIAFLALVSLGESLREAVDGLALDEFESNR
ncbi:hypothetical protein [Microbacterium lacticum]|uniref:hypothetical protein n=1 Tax=Microbacterium lacticum TaxID=33885 RepID=UPI001F59E013|nr:hypothetical protein [Microbacterium lacticum]